MQSTGVELHRIALHAYSYLHLPMIAGIVLFALGLEETVGHAGEQLETVPAVGLCVGAALYLARARRLPATHDRPALSAAAMGAVALLAALPVALVTPALAALALVAAVCAFVVGYEAIHYREHRLEVRHPT